MDQNRYLNQDQNDILEWIDYVPFQNSFVTAQHFDYDTPTPIFWKNAFWSVKWRVCPHEMRPYVGLNSCSTLPDDWMLRYKYSFALCPVPSAMMTGADSNGNDDTDSATDEDSSFVEKWTEVDVHTFTKPRDKEYDDHSILSLPSPSFIAANARTYVTPDNKLLLKCRLQAIPIPYSIQRDYNSKQSTGMVGLGNLGATCYLNALLQMLYHVNSFRRGVYDIPFENEILQHSTTLALQSIFSRLQNDSTTVSTGDLTRAFGWDNSEALQQQDVQEMMRILLDKLEERMKGTPADGTIQRLFVGKIKSYIRCVNVEYESSREEDFYDLQLDVRGCKNIYDSFSRYVAKEMLNGENQYDAGEGRGKQDAEKGIQFVKLPPVLTIHLKRFEFDMQRMGFAKIHDKYEFPLRLELDQFVQPNNDEDTSPDVNIYHLHSVLVHSGDVSGGHYIAFIRPSSGDSFWQMETVTDSSFQFGGRWYKFDDDNVTPADRREAVEMCYGSGYTKGNVPRSGDYSSAYMLVYIRETEAPQVMQVTEIPTELSNRLSQEKMKKTEGILHLKHQENFFDIDFFLESDLEIFEDYSESEDLISEKYSIKHQKVLTGCTNLGLIYTFALSFNKLPCEIELWKAFRRSDNHLRIEDCVRDFNQHVNPRERCVYFVRFVDETDPSVREESVELLRLQDEWIDALRNKYYSILPMNLNLTFDPCEGCTIGQGGYILRNFMTASRQDSVDDNIDQEDQIMNGMGTGARAGVTRLISRIQLIELYDELSHRAIINLQQTDSYDPHETSLIIFRAYDTEDAWTSLGFTRDWRLVHSTIIKQMNNENDSNLDDVMSGESDVDQADDGDGAGERKNKNNSSNLINYKTRRILYLGCMKMSLNLQFYKHLELHFHHLLQKLFLNLQITSLPNYWKQIQFVNIDTDADVLTFHYTPTKSLKELDIQSGDVLYCLPLFKSHSSSIDKKEEEQEEDEKEDEDDHMTTGGEDRDASNTPVDSSSSFSKEEEIRMNKLFATNCYVKDIQEFFENETTTVAVTVKFHKLFHYGHLLNRETGIWKFSHLPQIEILSSSDGTKIYLSKKKNCLNVIHQIEDLFHVNHDENRLLIGKTFTPQYGGRSGYRQLYHHSEKTLYEFFSLNIKSNNIKYLLNIVLLPFPISDTLLYSQQSFEFILCDQKLINLRLKWLKKFIFSQAEKRYQEQIQQLLEEKEDEEGDGEEAEVEILRSSLSPISFSLIWPENVMPVPDEFIFENKIYLKFENEDLTISEIIQQIKENIYGPQEEEEVEEGDVSPDSTRVTTSKRRIHEIASETESDNDEPEMESEAAALARKRARNELISTKRFISRDEFSLSPQVDFDVVENSNDSIEDDEMERSNNPYLYDDSPWSSQIYLTEAVQLKGTESPEDDWGGPYFIVFEIDDNKVGRIFEPSTTIRDLPCSWMDFFLKEKSWDLFQSLGVQCFSSEEWIFMNGAAVPHFGVRAIPLSVYSYELSPLGIAQSLSHETPPFLTYLRADDTLETLTDRIILHTGESDWEKMALVSRTFRPFQLLTSVGVQSPDEDEEKNDCGNHRGAEMNQTTSRVSKIWKVYEGFYGDYTSGRSTTQSIPLLGLQRSSRYPLDTDPPSLRYRKQSGIKIRG